MKKVYVFISLLVFTCASCQKKQVDLHQTEINPLKVDLTATTLKSKIDNVDITKIKRLTQVEYDKLELSKVKNLADYQFDDFSIGRTLMSDNKGKLLTVQVITDGEVTECLLSYDKDGHLVDSLIVAYQDMVEYYSEISSMINSDEIVVQTVNFTYEDKQGNPVELSDTITAKYLITPNLQFIAN